MKLEATSVGGEGTARQPRPFDRAFAFFDPLLAGAALVVEGNDILGGPCHVRHDEARERLQQVEGFRRIAMRNDRLAGNYFASVCLTAAIICGFNECGP